MSRRIALACALLATLGALAACDAAPASPAQTAELYFRYRSRDPLRLLGLFTPGFHRSHGMTLDAWLRTPPGAALLAARGRAAPEPAPWTLARAQAAWLDAQDSLALQAAASRLRATIESAESSGDRARVRARVESPGAAPFVQEFLLVRDPAGGGWRIDAVEQREIDASNLYAAFSACPRQATLDRLYAEGLLR